MNPGLEPLDVVKMIRDEVKEATGGLTSSAGVYMFNNKDRSDRICF
jgi:hypothetical protein